MLLASAAAVALPDFYGGFIAAVLSPVALVAYGVVSPSRPGESSLRRVAITSLVLAAAAAAGLVLIHRFGPAVLLRPGSLALYVSAWLGFYPREYEGETTWRWMGQTGALRVVATRESMGTVLELELKAFPRDRRVEWFLDGRRLGEVEVAAEWRRYKLPLGPLAPGETTLTLACRRPAIVANDVLHNDDPRALGLAVGSWRIEDVAASRHVSALVGTDR